MKPTLIDFTSSDCYVERRLSPSDLKANSWHYLCVGLPVFLFFCVLISIWGLPFKNGELNLAAIFFVWLPLLFFGVNALPSLLICKALTPQGIFITHRNGRVQRGILWQEVDSVAYQTIPVEDGYTFKVKANPKEGKSIVFKTTNPKVAAIIYVVLFQQSRQGAQTLERLVDRGAFTAGEPSQFEGFVIQFASQRLQLNEIQKKTTL